MIRLPVRGKCSWPGDESKPLRRIQSAAERGMPRDTVLVHEGVYRERVAPARGGQEGKPVAWPLLRGDLPGAIVPAELDREFAGRLGAEPNAGGRAF